MTDVIRFRASAWAYYILGGEAVIACYFIAPSGWPRVILACAVNLSASIAIAAGIRRNRPSHLTPWLLFGAAQLIYLSADVVFYTYHLTLKNFSYPAPADALYLGRYPFFVLGLVLVVRRRSAGRDPATLIDALVLGCGGALLSWLFLMQPYTSGSMGFLVRATSLAFPVMDLFVLVVAVRLMIGSGRRVLSFYLLTASILCLLFSDAVYGWMQLAGVYTTGNFLDATWMSAYLFFGAAALHPSMRQLSEQARMRASSSSLGRTVLLAGAVLIGPITLGVAADNPANRVVIAVTSGAVFLLVLARMHGLMADQQRAHAELARNQDELRKAIESLEELQHQRGHLLDDTVNAAEEERVAIASELHDGPIQELSALAYTLDVAGLHLGRGDVESAREAVAGVRTQLATQMNSLRRLMSELRPPVLDEGGIRAALNDYTTEFAQREGVPCDFTADIGELHLTPGIETTLFRVTQEALRNVAKHARATHVHVSLRNHPTNVRLRIEDDGVGFDQDSNKEFTRNGHFGLAGMRERVERAGCEWELTTAPGHGTSIQVLVPIAALASRAIGTEDRAVVKAAA